jgi:hypothetical protein
MIPAILAFGCTPAPAPDPSGEAVSFPHAAGYDAGALHGAEALVAASTCAGCHRDRSSAPACASCHSGYPHPEGWLAGAVHGGDSEGCTECHGITGLQAPSCTSCHPSYPHGQDWSDAGRHGAWALSRGSAEAVCGSCHGADLAGTPSSPACASCHPVYPHPAGFADRAVHGAADPATCAACHGDDGTGGVSGVACSRCHATFPHPADQRTAHLAVASRVGEAICLSCHAPGDGRFPIPAACGATCHGNPP